MIFFERAGLRDVQGGVSGRSGYVSGWGEEWLIGIGIGKVGIWLKFWKIALESYS